MKKVVNKKQELVELTPTEAFLQQVGFTMTLKEVADKHGRENGKLVKDFEKEIASLSPDRFESFNFSLEIADIQSGKGRKQDIKTYNLDFKMLVWYISKFDANLRADIVNYAFEKLQAENKQKLDAAVKEAKQLQKLITGECSIRRCITEAWNEMEEAPNESEVWQAMTWKNLAEATYVTKLIRVIPDGLNHIVGVMKHPGNVKYNPQLVRDTWEDYVEAGKPSPTERERLTTEYNIVLENYKKKFEELEQVRD